uniref:OTU domain-containing protein n=1 Tax=Macrostomum lignano TaxID=282301 RepID=A0A1I8GXA2_9PLAT
KSREAKRRRQEETPEAREQRLQKERLSKQQSRAAEMPAKRDARLQAQKESDGRRRSSEAPAERDARLEDLKERSKRLRLDETPAEREARLQAEKQRSSQRIASEDQSQREDRLQQNRMRYRASLELERSSSSAHLPSMLPVSATQVSRVSGDGNCWFRAISNQLVGTPIYMGHKELRRTIAARARPLLEAQTATIEAIGLTVDELIADTERSGVYVHEHIAPMLNQLLDVDYAIYQYADAGRLQLVQEVASAVRPAAAVVWLLYNRHGQHYDSLRIAPQV